MEKVVILFIGIVSFILVSIGFYMGKNIGAKEMPNRIEEVATPNKEAVYTITLTNNYTYITEITTNKTYRVKHEDINDVFLWLNL